MRRTILSLLIVLATLSCGSEDTKKQEDVKQDTSPNDTVTQDWATPDLPPQETTYDQNDTASPPPLNTSKQLAKALCKSHICPASGCTIPALKDVAAPDCQKSCEETLLEDPQLASKAICARNSNAQSFCDAFDSCQPATDLPPQCTAICQSMATCRLLGGATMGFNEADCQLICASYAAIPDWAEQGLACMQQAATDCSSPTLLTCIDAFDSQATCTTNICNPNDIGSCSIIPGEFETVEECAEQCSQWTPNQAFMAQACLDYNAPLPMACTNLRMACLEATQTRPDKAREFADAILQRCVVLKYLDTDPFGADLFSWELAGMVQGNPALYRPFQEALPCAQNLSPCPQTELAPYYCLYNISEEIKQTCSGLGDLCTPEAYADEMVIVCESTLVILEDMLTELYTMKTECVEQATTCEDKAACFSL